MEDKKSRSETWDCPYCGATYFCKNKRLGICQDCGTGLALRPPGGEKTPFILSEIDNDLNDHIGKIGVLVDGVVIWKTRDEVYCGDGPE